MYKLNFEFRIRLLFLMGIPSRGQQTTDGYLVGPVSALNVMAGTAVYGPRSLRHGPES